MVDLPEIAKKDVRIDHVIPAGTMLANSVSTWHSHDGETVAIIFRGANDVPFAAAHWSAAQALDFALKFYNATLARIKPEGTA